jgi:hypothetical protein
VYWKARRSVQGELGPLDHGPQAALFPRSNPLAVRQADISRGASRRLVQPADGHDVAQRHLRTATQTQHLQPREMLEGGAGRYSGRLQEQPLQTAPVSCRAKGHGGEAPLVLSIGASLGQETALPTGQEPVRYHCNIV